MMKGVRNSVVFQGFIILAIIAISFALGACKSRAGQAIAGPVTVTIAPDVCDRTVKDCSLATQAAVNDLGKKALTDCRTITASSRDTFQGPVDGLYQTYSQILCEQGEHAVAGGGSCDPQDWKTVKKEELPTIASSTWAMEGANQGWGVKCYGGPKAQATSWVLCCK